jgi:hypothetical protein
MRRNAALAIKDFPVGSLVEVRDDGGFKGVFAINDIKPDLVVFYLKGSITAQPSKYTIQVGSNRHLNLPSNITIKDDLNYCWQFLNHSCTPNGYINPAELTFRALRNIKRGEELSFNYLTTESELAVPFNCICGSPGCFGFIRGRNFLSPEEERRLSLSVGEDNLATLFKPAVRRAPLIKEI